MTDLSLFYFLIFFSPSFPFCLFSILLLLSLPCPIFLICVVIIGDLMSASFAPLPLTAYFCCFDSFVFGFPLGWEYRPS